MPEQARETSVHPDSCASKAEGMRHPIRDLLAWGGSPRSKSRGSAFRSRIHHLGR